MPDHATHEQVDESQGVEPGGSSIRVSPLSRLRGRVRWEPREWAVQARRRVREPGFVARTLPPTLLGVCVVVSTVMLGWMASTLYFLWADDYDFLLLRGTIEGVNEGWLAPHDDHWSSGTILIYRILFAFFGMREYLPYGLVPIVLHMLTVILVYAVLRRLGASGWQALVPGVILAFLGAGAGALLWNTTMGSVGAVTLGFLALWIGLRWGFEGRARAAVWITLVVALSMSGAGVTAVAFVAFYVLQRRGWRAAVSVAGVPTLVFLAWFVGFGRGGVKEPLTDPWAYSLVPQLLWQGLTTHLERLVSVEGSGAVVLAVLVGGLVLHGTPAPMRDLAIAGLVTAIFQVTLAGVTRPQFGSDTFDLTRYGYFTVVFLAPAMAVLVGQVWARLRGPQWLVASLAVWLVVGVALNGVQLFRGEQGVRQFVTGSNEGLLRGIRDASAAGATVLTPSNDDFVNSRFRADLIARPTTWPSLPEGDATLAERVAAESQYFVAVGDEAKGLPAPQGDAELDLGWRGIDGREARDGCAYYTAESAGAVIAVEADGPLEFGVFGPASRVETVIIRDGEQSGPRAWEVEPVKTFLVSTTVADATLALSVNEPGRYYICV